MTGFGLFFSSNDLFLPASSETDLEYSEGIQVIDFILAYFFHPAVTEENSRNSTLKPMPPLTAFDVY